MDGKKTTVKDIAQELKLSIGTVSRALANKSGVKDETRALVNDAANRMGYKMNRVAQSMARKPIVLGIIIPRAWKYHYGMLELGIKRELRTLIDYNIRGVFKYISGLHECEQVEEATESCIKEGIDLVILCPSFDKAYERSLDRFNEAGIPVILLGTDVAGGNRISCVSTDSRLSGNIAGEFMGHLLERGRRCAVLIGNKDMQEHKEKVEGFVEWFPYGNDYIGAFETQDEPELAFRITRKICEDYDDMGGIYVATGNSLAVCDCLREMGKEKTVKLIVTDVFHEIKENVEVGAVNAVIYQNQIKQGAEAARQAFEHVSGNNCKSKILVTPQLVLKSNIDYFRNREELEYEI